MGLYKGTKNNSKPVIRQVLDLIHRPTLQSCIRHFKSDKGCHKYKTHDQLVALFRTAKGSIKIHTCWDDTLHLPECVLISEAKAYTGTSENAVKSQIYVALICYMLVELMRRTLCKTQPAF